MQTNKPRYIRTERGDEFLTGMVLIAFHIVLHLLLYPFLIKNDKTTVIFISIFKFVETALLFRVLHGFKSKDKFCKFLLLACENLYVLSLPLLYIYTSHPYFYSSIITLIPYIYYCIRHDDTPLYIYSDRRFHDYKYILESETSINFKDTIGNRFLNKIEKYEPAHYFISRHSHQILHQFKNMYYSRVKKGNCVANRIYNVPNELITDIFEYFQDSYPGIVIVY